MTWTVDEIPDQAGKTVVITGANSGLGLETARVLARAGATIVMACRSLAKAEKAKSEIVSHTGSARVDIVELDLGDLDSVDQAARQISERYERLDVLCNNAGVMAIPRKLTASGFETQFCTNHLGHFALTGRLLPKLLFTPGARVVTVTSLMHTYGKMRFSDLQGEQRYDKWRAYQQSKLANLLFTFELARRASSGGHELSSVAAHPGYAATNLQYVGPEMSGSKVMHALSSLGNRFIAQSAAQGAYPTLFAATAPGVASGDLIGPGGFRQLWGPPRKVGCHPRARNEEDARRLWDASVRLTGVDFRELSETAAA